MTNFPTAGHLRRVGLGGGGGGDGGGGGASP